MRFQGRWRPLGLAYQIRQTDINYLTWRDPFTWTLIGYSIEKSKVGQLGSASGKLTFNIFAVPTISNCKN